jgi:uncharacterized protein (TIGR02996 family)
MTDTEAALQRALDEDPTNATIRLALADHLDEEGDPRGPGYRAMGVLGIHISPYCLLVWNATHYRHLFDPHQRPHDAAIPIADLVWPHYSHGSARNDCAWQMVPPDWFEHTTHTPESGGYFFSCTTTPKTRAGLEDQIAAAFTKLKARRQAELIAGHFWPVSRSTPSPVTQE